MDDDNGAAAADGDDVVLFDEQGQGREINRFPMLRQQETRTESQKNYLALSDFIAPVESGLTDHLGAFAVTAGLGANELAESFEKQGDDSKTITIYGKE